MISSIITAVGLFFFGCLLAFSTLVLAFGGGTVAGILMPRVILGGGIILGLFYRRKSMGQLLIPGLPFFIWFLAMFKEPPQESIAITVLFYLILFFAGFLPGIGILIGNKIKYIRSENRAKTNQ